MEIEVEITKELPVKQIDSFMDKTVYNMAVVTREYTKSQEAYPYLSGELSRQEEALPINGSNKEYTLDRGVDYASKVWTYTNVKWTNPKTQPQWYFNVFKNSKDIIKTEAINRAIKEV